jgi:opacity protein-like surface antigen
MFQRGLTMMSLSKKIFTVIFAVICFSMNFATVVLADDDTRYYIRLGGVNQSVDGDFNGENAGNYEENDHIWVVFPKIESATGYELAFGGQNGRLVGELSYAISEHDSEIVNAALNNVFNMGKTTAQKVSFDIKYLFCNPDSSVIIPYGQFGVSYNSFTTKNGAIDLDRSTTPATVKGHGDSTYKGYGYDLGVGLLCRLSAKIALEGSYVYSHISIDRIETLGYTGKPKDGMESDTREIRVGLNYYFK